MWIFGSYLEHHFVGTELCCAPSTCVVHHRPALCTMGGNLPIDGPEQCLVYLALAVDQPFNINSCTQIDLFVARSQHRRIKVQPDMYVQKHQDKLKAVFYTSFNIKKFTCNPSFNMMIYVLKVKSCICLS